MGVVSSVISYLVQGMVERNVLKKASKASTYQVPGCDLSTEHTRRVLGPFQVTLTALLIYRSRCMRENFRRPLPTLREKHNRKEKRKKIPGTRYLVLFSARPIYVQKAKHAEQRKYTCFCAMFACVFFFQSSFYIFATFCP